MYGELCFSDQTSIISYESSVNVLYYDIRIDKVLLSEISLSETSPVNSILLVVLY